MNNTQLKSAIRTKYAWPGGHEIYGVCDDGGVLCCNCMRAEFHQIVYARKHRLSNGWRVDAVTTTECDNDGVNCDHCAKVLSEVAS